MLKKALKKLGVDPLGRGAGTDVTDAEIEAELEKPEPFGALVFQGGARGGAASLTDTDLDALRSDVEAELEEDLDADAEFKALLETEARTADLLKREALVATPSDQQRGVFSFLKAAKALATIVFRVANDSPTVAITSFTRRWSRRLSASSMWPMSASGSGVG